ncbi:hypothetical protein D4Q52_05100 [Rhodopseudomonas palustris]|uniref:Uncharacterized protein n=2 Tax=Rhodopseudomonas palustris TaxID=1076 RepID=A0A418VK64_RHOPL|nr:hypothetical protein D4Q52_05100 [Rhodopseudomonas palustris]
MPYLVLFAVLFVLFLQASGAIPPGSVGGPLVIALALFVGALAVAIHEAWRRQRGPLGWIVNILLAFTGAFLAAPLGGMAATLLLSPFVRGSTSIAAAGCLVMAAALAATMIVTLTGAWGAIRVVNRWRRA